jgi:hypothetical protein
MERRLRFFEQMRHRLETIQDESLDLQPRKEDEKKGEPVPASKNEYVDRVKARLGAWTNELDRWETESYKVDLDEECAARLAKLDQRLLEGYEKMRDRASAIGNFWIISYPSPFRTKLIQLISFRFYLDSVL